MNEVDRLRIALERIRNRTVAFSLLLQHDWPAARDELKAILAIATMALEDKHE